MTTRDIVMSAAGGTTTKTYIEDVFSTNLWLGNGTSQTITTGIDTSTKGGLVWIKDRDLAIGHYLWDTSRGASNALVTTTTNAQQVGFGGVSAFTSSGFSVDSSGATNGNLDKYVGWTFRKAPKFFDVQTKSHTNGTTSTITFPDIGYIGMAIAKRTDSTGDWYVVNTQGDGGANMLLNTTAAQFTSGTKLLFNYSDVTTVQLDSSLPTGTYVIYAFAHDTSTNGLIKAAYYTGNASTNGPVVNLGWEPQYVLIKRATGGTGSWQIFDNMRGVATGYVDAALQANAATAESITNNFISFTSTGFTITSTSTEVNASAGGYNVLAIRRGPMKTPTDGTKVFQPVVRTGSGTTSVVDTTITPDLVINKQRSGTGGIYWLDRLRDDYYVQSASTVSEAQTTLAFPVQMWDNETGYDIAGTSTGANSTSYSYVNWVFKRAPGFFDIVNVSQNITNTKHNLEVTPELMIFKARSSVQDWYVAAKKEDGNSRFASLNLTNAFTNYTNWGTTFATSTEIVKDLSPTFVANPAIYYLFASCPGVSKVGTYTGTGSTLQVDCGFTAGARFVMIKRTDSTGDWYVYDTARGLVTGNDPYLLMNSTAAEVTTTDYIDPYNAGFELSSTAPAALNANGGTYLYLAIA